MATTTNGESGREIIFVNKKACFSALSRSNSRKFLRLCRRLGLKGVDWRDLFASFKGKKITVQMVNQAYDEWEEQAQRKIQDRQRDPIEDEVEQALSNQAFILLGALMQFIAHNTDGADKKGRRRETFQLILNLVQDGTLKAPNVSERDLWAVLANQIELKEYFQLELKKEGVKDFLPLLVYCETSGCKRVQVSLCHQPPGKRPFGHWLVKKNGNGSYISRGYCNHCRKEILTEASESQSGYLTFLPRSASLKEARRLNDKTRQEQADNKTCRTMIETAVRKRTAAVC